MVNNGKPEAVGFPPISWEEEALATRPLPLHELPVQVGIDMAMALIDTHHAHIGKAIRVFWGSRDCVEYMQKLVLSGGDQGRSSNTQVTHRRIRGKLGVGRLERQLHRGGA
jgi:hypothetical protein